MSHQIVESGIPFVAVNSFRIEQWNNEHKMAYKNLRDGIKSVEFVRRKDNALVFVEAKKTFSNENDGEEKFDRASKEIVDKFLHSLNLYASIALGLYPGDISETDNLSGKSAVVIFVLVIRDHRTDRCKEVRKKLNLLLNQHTYIRKIWRPSVYVINYSTAVKRGLAQAGAVI
jgi:hypothetical protein